MHKLAVSLLDINYGCLERDLAKIAEAGIPYIHFDVMDGIFVPNIGIGIHLISGVRSLSKLTFDVHLMIEEPRRYIERFVKAGADIITVHYEACSDLEETIRCIKELGIKAGVALKPETMIRALEPDVLKMSDVVQIMTTKPGVEGQDFIPSSIEKIAELHELLQTLKLKCDIEVDGNITEQNVSSVIDVGATVIVSGRALVHGNMEENIFKMEQAIQKTEAGDTQERAGGLGDIPVRLPDGKD